MYKKIIVLAAMLAILLAGYFYWGGKSDFETSDLPAVSYEEATEAIEVVADNTENDSSPVIEETVEAERPKETNLPGELNLAVPFTSQAPKANWDLPYQEMCEEASVYMVAEYFAGTKAGKIDAEKADSALLQAIAFEEELLGTYLDTTAEETVKFIESFYGLEAQVIKNPTVEEIKAEVAAGRPVIVPAAGRQLGNPNFTGEGPLYHMLVIKGYTAGTFITNDPGTRNGENYVYDIATIMEAMGDWNDGSPATGAKVVIFVSKP